jgi:ribosomal protein L10
MNRTSIGLAAGASVAALALGVGTALAGNGHHAKKAHAVRAAKAAGHGGEVRAAAGYLGLTVAELRADLKAGKTLAQVADATPGKSADGLVQALVAAAKAKLDAAVAAGKITAAQESQVLSRLTTLVTAVVNG